MEEKIQLKKGIYFVRHEADIILVYAFGRRIFLKGPQTTKITPSFLESLKTPISTSELNQKFHDLISPTEMTAVIDQLMQFGFLHFIKSQSTEDTSFNSAIDQQNYFFLNYFSNTHSSIFQSLTAAHKTVLGVVNLGQVGINFLNSAEQLSLKAIHYYDPFRVSQADIMSYPEIFKNEDLNKSRSKILESRSPLDSVYFFENQKLALKTTDLVVVFATWFNQNLIRELNLFFRQNKKKWLLVIEDDFGGSLGPWFGPHDGPCFECLFQRRMNNMEYLDQHKVFEEHFGREENRQHLFPLYNTMIANFATSELFHEIYSTRVSLLTKGLKEVDLLNMKFKFNELFPLPYCTVCSSIMETPLTT